MKGIIFALILLICINIVDAAVIHGTVYDLSLKKVNNAIVEIDTEPNQRFVAKDGDYSFSVPEGDYKITAAYRSFDQNFLAEESLSVKFDGDYIFDLFLFPVLNEDDIIDDELTIETEIIGDRSHGFLFIFLSVVLLLLLSFYYYNRNRKQKIRNHRPSEMTEIYEAGKAKTEKSGKSHTVPATDTEGMVDFIKKNDGRTTQKEIRKEFPLSEAKISLMITELEHKGTVRRIKKGRGNVIILNPK